MSPPGPPDGGARADPRIRRVLAPNPGPMTLQGTNTWVLGNPGEASVVVDPGPADPRHEAAVLAEAGRVAIVLVTHRHADHTAGAAELAARAGCAVRAVDQRFRVGAADPGEVPGEGLAGLSGLSEGDRIACAGGELTVLATPGHTDDSVCLLLRLPGTSDRLLTGDTVLGQGTTVIAEPDGDLGDYLSSLARLRALVAAGGVAQLLPGHGPAVDDPGSVLDYYRRHRLERIAQVQEALAAGDQTAAQVVARVYADVDRALWPAAEQSVRACLRYLERPG